MKSVILILFIAVSGAVYAQQTVLQKYSPQFTVGTKIDYALDYNGQPVQYNLTIKSMADPIIEAHPIAKMLKSLQENKINEFKIM